MTNRVNAKSTREILEEHFKADAELLKDASTVFTFAHAVTTGNPLSWAAGVALILETAGAALAGATNVAKRMREPSPPRQRRTLREYERFKVLFYTRCARSYIEAISEVIQEVDLSSARSDAKPPMDAQAARIRARLQIQLANLEEAEVTYLFGINPMDGTLSLFDGYTSWLSSALAYHGLDDVEARSRAQACCKLARTRFNVFLASESSEAEWMRRYLALAREENTNRLLDSLATIQTTLSDWLAPGIEQKTRMEAAWQEYREMLRLLPDQKESMFNEQFGVRKVFVKPQASYHVAGISVDPKPKVVPDIAQVIGALISTRVSGEDLIILSGGPGSGKSTLCRILASELAKDHNVHPIFLRLRRLKEGSDIASFVEESLVKQGVINRLSDLRDLPNLVLILDGFDELVMASRARLRHFFNVLREEHSSGPLRNARMIISGRDTLFPKGEGLPTGSHILTLQPFSRDRVEVWGKKWRKLHKAGPGSTFTPTSLLEEPSKPGRKRPLHHLVSWPLTLHLVARVHTAGRLDLAGKQSHEIEKAYLYRSILVETAVRQTNQAEGRGRLVDQQMREFLRALAWKMYRDATDSLDPTDVIPLLQGFFPDTVESELAELADVAVVNCPELTKGEETGFEFVHKSFAEYLVAEEMALVVEHVIFKAPEFGSRELTWRMSPHEAIAQLAPVLSPRLITEEVQEMLEPMLGSLEKFLEGQDVADVVSGEARKTGLSNVVSRFEQLVAHFLQGKDLNVVAAGGVAQPLSRSPLEAYAHFAAGVVLIGVAAARQMKPEQATFSVEDRTFDMAQSEGALWRFLSILTAGGLIIDEKLAMRLYRGMSLQRSAENAPMDDFGNPFRLRYLNSIAGYEPSISMALEESLHRVNSLWLRSRLLVLLIAYFNGERADAFVGGQMDVFRHDRYHRGPFLDEIEPVVEALHRAGIVDAGKLDRESHGWPRAMLSLHGLHEQDVVPLLEHTAREWSVQPRNSEEAEFGRLLSSILSRSDELKSHPETRRRLARLLGRLTR